MLVTGNFLQVQINYQPFWEKPPLFFWMQALSMSWLGVGGYAARLPNAIIGIFTIFALYQTGSRWRNPLFGRLVSLLYLATLLPSIYFKSGIIDPTFNFFIFLGLMNIFRFEEAHPNTKKPNKRFRPAIIGGIWIGVATLTKGPVALLVSALIYGIYKALWSRKHIHWAGMSLFVLSFLLTISVWYGLETAVHGPWFVNEFISYQLALFSQDVAGHAQPFYYHLVVFVMGCFPVSAFTFRAMALKGGDQRALMLRRVMIIWFWVVMVLFSIVKTKIIHYSSLLYFPAAFLSADLLFAWMKDQAKPRWDTWVLLSIGVLVWGLVPALLNLAQANLPFLEAYVKDPIASGAMLAEVTWSGWEWCIGAGFLVVLGMFLLWIRKGEYLSALWLQAIGTLVFINLLYVFVAPKAGQHLQGAPQAFYKGLAEKDVYVLPARYKSYLPYFYSQLKPPGNPGVYNNDWLIHGEIDKDVYLSVQAHREDEAFHQQFRTFERLYEEDGFVFYIRRKARPWLGLKQ